MLVQFKEGAAGYGLGYVPGEVVDMPEKIIGSQWVKPVVNGQALNKVQNQKKEFTLRELMERGVCIPATEKDLKEWTNKITIQAQRYSGAKA
jgi:hypothetical protein